MRRGVAAAFAMALASAVFLTGCQSGFVGAGHDGGAAPTPVDRMIQANGDNRLPPREPVCGRTVVVSARATRQVADCATVDYGPLYRRANEVAAKLVAGMACPADCKPPVSAETARVWSCTRLNEEAPSVAAATVEHDAICPRPTDAPPAALDPPSAEELTQPLGALADLRGQPGLIEDIGEGTVLACPSRQVVQFDYEETAPATCQRRRFDFERYVLRATDLAKRHFETYGCMPDCSRQEPFAAIRRQWRCHPADQSRVVQVKLWFDVRCIRPQ